MLAACGGGNTAVVLAPAIPDDPAVSDAVVTVSLASAIDDEVTVHDAGGSRPLRLRGYRASLAAAIAAHLPVARRDLKEAGDKPLARRTGTA